MNIVSIPGTDLQVSQLVFGCWGITTDFHWGSRDEQESVAAIHAALDRGVNFFDTAAAYGDGNSERLLGKALAGKRERVVIASKVKPDQMQPDQIPVACEQTLERLGVDCLDLYQTHWANPDVPLADSWAALLKLQEQGKALPQEALDRLTAATHALDQALGPNPDMWQGAAASRFR
jgi:aryl-alcohol dehydrogenase-like predicted oxidoreductase